MKLLCAGGGVTAIICVALCCLASSGLVRNALANQGQSQTDDTRTCENQEIELSGANSTLKFKCKGKAKLVPAEKTGHTRRSGDDDLTKVFQFTPAAPAKSQPSCGGPEMVLSQLVPNSVLRRLTGQKSTALVQSQDESVETVFELKTGEGREHDTHLCYICTPDTPGSGSGVRARADLSDQTSAKNCTVYVTVPRKAISEPPSEEHSDSGSSSPSTLGWLALSATVTVLGLMSHP